MCGFLCLEPGKEGEGDDESPLADPTGLEDVAQAFRLLSTNWGTLGEPHRPRKVELGLLAELLGAVYGSLHRFSFQDSVGLTAGPGMAEIKFFGAVLGTSCQDFY